MMKISGDTAYSGLAKGVSKTYATLQKDVAELIVIAKFIKEGIEAKNPKTRYAGVAGAKIMPFFRKILSDKQFDKLIMSQMK